MNIYFSFSRIEQILQGVDTKNEINLFTFLKALTDDINECTGNITNDFSVSFAISGAVYNVPGQLAHTHAFIQTQNSAHVRFNCAKTENSGQRADQPYAAVICCA